MTADQAIQAAKAAFGERDVAISVADGVLKVESRTHHAEVAMAHAIDSIPDEALVDAMLPEAVAAMDRNIASGKAPLRLNLKTVAYNDPRLSEMPRRIRAARKALAGVDFGTDPAAQQVERALSFLTDVCHELVNRAGVIDREAWRAEQD